MPHGMAQMGARDMPDMPSEDVRPMVVRFQTAAHAIPKWLDVEAAADAVKQQAHTMAHESVLSAKRVIAFKRKLACRNS